MKLNFLLIVLIGFLCTKVKSQTPTLIDPGNSTIFSMCDTVTERGYNWWSCGTLLKNELFTVYKNYTGLLSDDSMHIYKTWEDSTTYLLHVKYLQYYKGIPIESMYYTEHSLRDTVIVSNGFVCEAMNKSSSPSFTESEALDSALAHIDAERFAWDDSIEYYLKYDSLGGDTTYYPKGELIWTLSNDTLKMNDQANYVLSWKFNIYFFNYSPDTVFNNYNIYVNANNGSIIKTVDNARYGTFNHYKYGSKSFDTRYLHNKYYLETDDDGKRIKTKDRYYWTSWDTKYLPEDGDDNWGNDNWGATAAHWGVENAWQYWRDVWKRDGIDDGALTLHIHANSGSKTYFSNDKSKGSSSIVIGTNNGFYDGVIDIIGHEYTHGVIKHSCDLEAVGEPGALAESYGDIFGYLLKRSLFGSTNWTIGEDSDPSYVRDFQNPQNVTPPSGISCGMSLYPRFYFEPGAWAFYGNCGFIDDYYAHHNCTVQDQCFFLLANGGSLNGISVPAIGIGEASVIVHLAMTQFLHSKALYKDSREAWIAAAIFRFGKCSNEHLAVCRAWAACNVGSTCFCFPSPVSCGQQFVKPTSEIPMVPFLDINTINIRDQIKIFPTPTNDIVNIDWGLIYDSYKGTSHVYNIIDQYGKNVITQNIELNDKISSINISSLSSGIYTIGVYFGNQYLRYKIIKL